MNMIGCKCLNIIIETEASKFPVVKKDQLELTIAESEDNFFQNEHLRQVERLDNINRSLPGLVETREVGSWLIHYCINCKVHTHAVHKQKGASCVLVNPNLLTSDAIKKLRNSENFSKSYGIVIDPSQFDDEIENEDIFYPSDVEPIVKGIKQTLTETMRKEAALVEERIKQFTDEQYITLDNLREKLFNEEQTLIRTVLSHESTKPKKNKVEEKEIPQSEGLASPKLKESPERISSQTPPNQLRHTPKRQKSTPVQNNYDSEFLFDFDGIDDNEKNEKDDEVASDMEDAPNMKANDRHNSRTRSSSIKIAKSLPMDIPVFMRPRKEEEVDLVEDIMDPLEDNVDIAASIKKLAKSVHGGGIFGDLPRPRFSTQL